MSARRFAFLLSERMRSAAGALATLIMLLVVVPDQARAIEVLSASNEFVVYHSLANIVLDPADAATTRVFVDPVRMLSATENAELHPIAIGALRSRAQIAPNKESANYFLQIIMQEKPDYAIRNPRREPARAYILLSICKYPIGDVSRDCSNIEYYYFTKYEKRDVFPKVVGMWIETVFHATPK